MRVCLTCVRAGVYFEVLQPGKALAADGTLVGFLVGVCADMYQHLVPTQKTRIITLDVRTHARTFCMDFLQSYSQVHKYLTVTQFCLCTRPQQD